MLIEEFFRIYFQEAADPMQAYYERLNLVGREYPEKQRYVEEETWTPLILRELAELLDQARESARQEVVQRRVRRECEALKAYQLAAQALALFQQWKKEGTPQNLSEVRQALTQAHTFLQQIADEDIVAEAVFADALQRKIGRHLPHGEARTATE